MDDYSDSPEPSPIWRLCGWLWGDSAWWRGGLGLAGLAVLICLFYQEENWRGRRAWARCQQEAAARGLAINWTAFTPPPVPNDENFFKAPHMQEWFT
ncbi:MAG: hypothetical protein JWQ04_1246, partial [Pedosphaera sp.]|nr:hypothetical protein [Pedosphaera sp.]